MRDSITLHAFNLDLIADPNKQVKCVRDKDGGVSKGFIIIKPSRAKYEEYRQEYLSTPYNPVTGWNGQGHNDCKGKLGLKGFFSYKALNNQIDEQCISQQNVDSSKVVRHARYVCGEPRDCPYDHPRWSAQKKEACQKVNAKYFKSRYEMEK